MQYIFRESESCNENKAREGTGKCWRGAGLFLDFCGLRMPLRVGVIWAKTSSRRKASPVAIRVGKAVSRQNEPQVWRPRGQDKPRPECVEQDELGRRGGCLGGGQRQWQDHAGPGGLWEGIWILFWTWVDGSPGEFWASVCMCVCDVFWLTFFRAHSGCSKEDWPEVAARKQEAFALSEGLSSPFSRPVIHISCEGTALPQYSLRSPRNRHTAGGLQGQRSPVTASTWPPALPPKIFIYSLYLCSSWGQYLERGYLGNNIYSNPQGKCLHSWACFKNRHFVFTQEDLWPENGVRGQCWVGKCCTKGIQPDHTLDPRSLGSTQQSDDWLPYVWTQSSTFSSLLPPWWSVWLLPSQGWCRGQWNRNVEALSTNVPWNLKTVASIFRRFQAYLCSNNTPGNTL